MNKIILYCWGIAILSVSQIAASEKITIGSKIFSESIILGEMLSILLEENHSLPVEKKLALGGTQVAFSALESGGIDVYPEYTGTGHVVILKKKERETNPEKVYQIVRDEFEKKWGIIWSAPLGFNNTYAVAVRASDPQFRDIKTISQLKGKLRNVKYAAAYEFMAREDGHDQMVKSYGLNFSPENVISMEAGLMYSAVKEEQVDMIVSYSTDGRIGAYDLRLLEDDNNFFPPYHAAFITRGNTLKKYPKLELAIQALEGQINELEMTKMNDLVDRLNESPHTVAKNFLITKGLIKGVVSTTQTDLGFLNYFLSEKDYLLKILREHLVLSFGSLILAFFLSLPVGIMLTRYQSMGKVVFPIINTIQTIPSLALLGFLIPVVGIGTVPALLALFLYSLLPLVRNTYTGILSVDKTYIDASRGIGLTGWQILFKVEIPLALPIIIAGVRTATAIVIGTATLAALVGAGGLGDPIFRGISTVNSDLILLGAIPAALLVVVVDKLIGISENLLVSEGLRLQNRMQT